jgi:membrane associated rhomboid family serine protease
MAPIDLIPEPKFTTGDAVLSCLIAVCVAVELALSLADFGLLDYPRLRALAYDYGAFWPGLLRNWTPNFPAQPWTMFLTYGFLHGGLLHLAFNMLTLRSLGRVVIERIGCWSFVTLYFASMVGGAAFYALTSTNGTPMVGASGALFGLAGALTAWQWTAQPNTRASLRATWRLISFLLGINVVMFILFSGGIAWQTHLGGMLAGWFAGLILDRDSEGRS